MEGFELPDQFYENTQALFQKALKEGSVLFNGDGAVDKIKSVEVGDINVDFQLTLLTSLMHRPEIGSRECNPFENPEPELTILEKYGPENAYRLVFNKFPVVPNHFMLVTREFESQNSPLSPSQLFASYKVLEKIKSESGGKNERWFAFFNCGPESGASQPHKHIQFMTQPPQLVYKPFSDLVLEQAPDPKKPGEIFQSEDIPFAHFLIKLPRANDILEITLATSYSALLQKTLTVLKQNDQYQMSYNLIMTNSYMLMIPRSSGKYKDQIGINSCGFQGLILCKNEELLNLVEKVGPMNILREVGFSNNIDTSSQEIQY